MKQDQDALERQLWEERRSIYRKYEEKLKAAKTKYVFVPSLYKVACLHALEQV